MKNNNFFIDTDKEIDEKIDDELDEVLKIKKNDIYKLTGGKSDELLESTMFFNYSINQII